MSPKLQAAIEKRANDVLLTFKGRGDPPEPFEVLDMMRTVAYFTYYTVEDGFQELRNTEISMMRSEIQEKQDQITSLKQQLNELVRSRNAG